MKLFRVVVALVLIVCVPLLSAAQSDTKTKTTTKQKAKKSNTKSSATKKTTPSDTTSKQKALTLPISVGWGENLLLAVRYDYLSLYEITKIDNLSMELSIFYDVAGRFGLANLVSYHYRFDPTWSIEAKIGPAFIQNIDSLQFLQYGITLNYALQKDMVVGVDGFSDRIALHYHLQL